MLTYEYECPACQRRFERRQSMTEEPLGACPECGGAVRRRVSGGLGFVVKGGSPGGRASGAGGCARESTGRTCCGREERCDKPPCGGRS